MATTRVSANHRMTRSDIMHNSSSNFSALQAECLWKWTNYFKTFPYIPVHSLLLVTQWRTLHRGGSCYQHNVFKNLHSQSGLHWPSDTLLGKSLTWFPEVTERSQRGWVGQTVAINLLSSQARGPGSSVSSQGRMSSLRHNQFRSRGQSIRVRMQGESKKCSQVQNGGCSRRSLDIESKSKRCRQVWNKGWSTKEPGNKSDLGSYSCYQQRIGHNYRDCGIGTAPSCSGVPCLLKVASHFYRWEPAIFVSTFTFSPCNVLAVSM